jgi:hypothetical protein
VRGDSDKGTAYYEFGVRPYQNEIDNEVGIIKKKKKIELISAVLNRLEAFQQLSRVYYEIIHIQNNQLQRHHIICRNIY